MYFDRARRIEPNIRVRGLAKNFQMFSASYFEPIENFRKTQIKKKIW